jgi:xylulokinase
VSQALAGLDKSRLAAVAVSGQQHGLVAVDARGCVIRPAKLWCDVEASAEAAELSAFTGVSTPPGFTAPKFMWLKRHERAHFDATKHVLLPHDYVNFVLTGKTVCESSDASGTGVFDAKARKFDARACEFVDPRLLGPSGDTNGGGPGALLPVLVAPHALIGRVTAAAAQRFGLPEGCLVAPGGGDNAMAALGAGAVTPGGMLVCSLGTSGTLFCAAHDPIVDASGCVAPFCDAAGVGGLPLLCTQNCTGPAAEVRTAFGMSHTQADEAALAAGVPDVSTTNAPLLFLPYLGGERTPNWPHATGCVLNLRPGTLTQPGRLYRAAVEGAAFAMRDGYERMTSAGVAPASELLLVGGAAASDLWASVIAGAFNLPVRRAGETEAAALGAALQAGAVADNNFYGNVAAYVAAHAPPPAGETIMPDPAHAAYYQAAFARFREAGQTLFGTTYA